LTDELKLNIQGYSDLHKTIRMIDCPKTLRNIEINQKFWPDLFVENPTESQVWIICGKNLIRSDQHTSGASLAYVYKCNLTPLEDSFIPTVQDLEVNLDKFYLNIFYI
jgi:hypothetical protein